MVPRFRVFVSLLGCTEPFHEGIVTAVQRSEVWVQMSEIEFAMHLQRISDLIADNRKDARETAVLA